MNPADKAYGLAKSYEQAYRGCGQCVVAAIQDAFDRKDEDIFRAATGFAGGGGLCGDGNCGAYSGGIMMLGYVTGRPRDDFEDRGGVMFKNFALIQAFRDRFIEEYGSIICRDIHRRVFGRPFDFLDPEQAEQFERAGGHTDKCPEVVAKAARWVAELLSQAGIAGLGQQRPMTHQQDREDERDG
jgi:C_GCAxxG_C_C family probable redox protein